MQIPNGLTFYVPELDWRPRQYSSFDGIVDALFYLIRQHPRLQAKYSTNRRAIEEMVDQYNATICAQMGWTDYVQKVGGAGSAPKHDAEQQADVINKLKLAAAKAKELMSGLKASSQWLTTGLPAVPPEQSAARAAICAACPMNEQGDFSKWFSVSVAELVRKNIAKLEERGLSTPDDNKVNVCMACSSPIRLNVHVPVQLIKESITPEQALRLKNGRNCWVLSETA